MATKNIVIDGSTVIWLGPENAPLLDALAELNDLIEADLDAQEAAA